MKDSEEEHEEQQEEQEELEEGDFTEYTEDLSFAMSDDHRRVVIEHTEIEESEETETQELDGTLSVKSEEGSRVKKFVVSYETKVLKSPSPAPSHGKHSSFYYSFYFKNDKKYGSTRICTLLLGSPRAL